MYMQLNFFLIFVWNFTDLFAIYIYSVHKKAKPTI